MPNRATQVPIDAQAISAVVAAVSGTASGHRVVLSIMVRVRPVPHIFLEPMPDKFDCHWTFEMVFDLGGRGSCTASKTCRLQKVGNIGLGCPMETARRSMLLPWPRATSVNCSPVAAVWSAIWVGGLIGCHVCVVKVDGPHVGTREAVHNKVGFACNALHICGELLRC